MDENIKMRSRKSTSREIKLNEETYDLTDEKTKYPLQTVPFYFGIIFLLFLLSICGIVKLIDERLPTPYMKHDELNNPDKFITERAQEDLKYLTDLGPRILGSYENEVLTVEYLKKQIIDIIHRSNNEQKIEYDIQLVSGSYLLTRKNTKVINIYGNVQNVVVKLHGIKNNHSLLLNSHFDSVPTSPGGTDDGINVAAMLEVLRKFSKHKEKPLHNIIFLFNGAEETGLQASHGFITKHKWAKECKVLINLEGAGGGGKIKMFQTGPNKPWLNVDYSKVPHPYGQGASEELFQANVIPSDTDFRIFRDFGNMIGIDMAFVRDGYRYHTKYDGFNNIPLGSYQLIGDNLMSLCTNIANNPELSNDDSESGNVVFFDYLGGLFVSYKTSTAFLLNVVIFLTSIITFLISLNSFNLGLNIDTAIYFIQIFGLTLFGWILSIIVTIIFTFFIDFIGYGMSWYGHPWLVIGLFVVPTILTSTPMLLFIRPMNVSNNTNCFIQAQVIRIAWSLLLISGTLIGIRSVYPLTVVVLFDTLCYLGIIMLGLQHSIWKWKLVYIFVSLIPTTFSMSLFIEISAFFIPLTGRIGSNKIPDLIIGNGCVLLTLLTLTPYYFLITTLRKPLNFYKFLVGVFLINLVIVFTPFGFPYSGDENSPTPQRYWILHSQRLFHDENGGIIKKDSGYFFSNMDRNSPYSVKNYVDEIGHSVNIEDDCNNFLLCGLPLAHSKMTEIVKYSTWIPASSPIIPQPVELILNSKEFISDDVLRYNLTIYGPDRLMIYMSPKKNLKLIKMNFIDKIEENELLWNERPYYFFAYNTGKEFTPLNAIFDLLIPKNYTKKPMIDIAVSGNYVHPKKIQLTPNFKKFLSKFPIWADVTAWVANYQSWIM